MAGLIDADILLDIMTGDGIDLHDRRRPLIAISWS
jgi:hypothetical protein